MLTREMVQNLNVTLTKVGVGFVYLYIENDLGPYAKVTIKDNNQNWVESSIINLTSDFYSWLDTWFWDNYKMKITYNNNKNLFWIE